MERLTFDIDTNSTVHGDGGQTGDSMNPARTGKRLRPVDTGAPKSDGTTPPGRWGWILQPQRWHVPRMRSWTLQRSAGTLTPVPVPIERGR